MLAIVLSGFRVIPFYAKPVAFSAFDWSGVADSAQGTRIGYTLTYVMKPFIHHLEEATSLREGDSSSSNIVEKSGER